MGHPKSMGKKQIHGCQDARSRLPVSMLQASFIANGGIAKQYAQSIEQTVILSMVNHI